MQQDFIDNLGLDEETAALVRSEHQKVIESYESRIRTLTVESAVKQAVAAAGGRNLTAIRALMDESAIEGDIEASLAPCRSLPPAPAPPPPVGIPRRSWEKCPFPSTGDTAKVYK